MSSPKDYTIGWICAISMEYVAAQAFLDERHKGPECVSPNDNNDYTLGRVGKHNVVIAVLPDGEYGISSAASVARDMLHSFPNVRIGLMVGIGGGAPSRKHDIRLGDIVISAPRNGKSGVFQYDFGKTIQNQTTNCLRTAVSGLRAQYESEGHQLETTINTVLDKKPRLRKKYKRPDSSSDRLYQSGVTHPPNNESGCTSVCGNDPSNLISRPERTEEEDNPAIHYGMIASANQLIKDALVRDTLAAEEDVLCFEMEAAGLMNHFPCLVIRGICDYSDSHKNKEWQGYAAMAAAAYAKDLLCRISPNRVDVGKTIIDNLFGIQESVDKLIRMQHDREHEAVLEWLTSIDYASQQNDFTNRRQEGTGQWLLNSSEFQKWFKQEKLTLFCPGIPGAGKTIITSIVVEYLHTKFMNDTSVGVIFIYCSYQPQQEQNPEDLLLSFLKQLAQKRSVLPPDIKRLYEHHRTNRTRPIFDEIVEVLHSTIELFSRVFIIIDALDEYYASNNGGLKRLLLGISSLQHQSQLNIFATSRPIVEITSQFQGCVLKEIWAQDEDVLCYVNGRIPQLLRSQISKYSDIQDTIRRAIVKAADGMFLLAQLHMDSLASQPTLGDIKQALRNLPQGVEGLDETYRKAMERIQCQAEGYKKLAQQVLCWVTHAKRALSTLEIRHALAVRANTVQLDEDFLPEIEILSSVCAGLIIIDKNSDIVRLVHYTTQKYFEQVSLFPNADREIMATCVTYLLFDTFATGFCPTDEEFETRLQLNPLYDYAARNWGHHARTVSMKDQLILGLLEDEAKMSACSQALMASRNYSGYSQRVPRQTTAVHLAAYFGLVETMMGVLKNEYNPDLRDSYGQTPLSWAAQEGHEMVVKLLLAKDGVDINSKDSMMGLTALSLAAERGHEAVVKLLLGKDGVDINSKDSKRGLTALLLAAERGHEAVVELLLAKGGVNVDSKGLKMGLTALSLAAMRGHEAVVELLLAKDGVDVNSKDSRMGRTALSLAAGGGHEAVVKLLLAKDGVDITSKDSMLGWTALFWAADRGHETVVKLLLEKDRVDINSIMKALSLAAEKGHEAVVELLFAKSRVDVNSKDSVLGQMQSWATDRGYEAAVKQLLAKDGVDINPMDSVMRRTALLWAAQRGHEAVVKLLLPKDGADINSKDSVMRWTALSLAAGGGHEAVVKLLLAKDGVNINSKNSEMRWTALLLAAEGGHEAVVKLLLAEDGVDINSKDSKTGLTVLSVAAARGHEAVVKLLLAKDGVDVNSKDSMMGWTALSWVADRGHEAVVKLLLAKDGVDINSRDSMIGRTALPLAAARGHEAVVKLLLAKDGVDVNSKDSKRGLTALSLAAEEGHEAVVKLLLAKDGVDINSKDSMMGRTALSLAAGRGHKAVVKLLQSHSVLS
ncbi:MAG: hypothetical protein M1840_000648 [Geoglossum simile]|nr:MAG: hypothetical protein M1840_000648 [Geoglossum simile]